MRDSSLNGGYSVRKSVHKGVFHGVFALLPAAAGMAAAALAAPHVDDVLASAWPAVPVAVIVGAITAALNWWKNAVRR